MVRTILVAMALALLGTSALAKTADDLRSSIAELRKAEALANSAEAFFRREDNDASEASTTDERADSFRRLHGAIDLFVRAAPKPITVATLNRAQAHFREPLRIPRTLSEVVEECERRNDAGHTRRVVSGLIASLVLAREDLEAEAKFGPLSDNPTFYGAVIPTANGPALLRNLAFALDHNVVLRRDFYAVETLYRFFGARPAVYRQLNGRIWAAWFVRPAGAEVIELEPGAERYAGCQYSLGLSVGANGKKSGAVGIHCNFKANIGPTFDQVEQVFGPDWYEMRDVIPHYIPTPPTAPRGNARIAYDFDKGSLGRTIEVSFGPAATFRSFDFRVEER